MRVLGLMFLLLTAVTKAEVVAVTPEQMQRLGVVVAPPEVVDQMPLGLVPGQVTVPPANAILISAPLAGVVQSLEAARGDGVTAGQVLAVIDSPELLQHQQRLLDAWQELRVAEAAHRRENGLYRAGVIPKSRWQETGKRWRQARTAYLQAYHALELMGMAPAAIHRLRDAARLDSRLELRAPATAVVRDVTVMVGQRVVRADPLLRLIAPKPLWLELTVPVALAAQIEPGARVETLEGGASGQVIRIARLVDPDSQTVLVRAGLDHPKGLRPGRKVSARLIAPVSRIMKLPRGALVEQEGRYVAFVRRREGFEVRPVTPLRLAREAVWLKEGLRPGEAVAVRGTAALKAAWLGVGEGD